jgi:hypothetical protein
MAKITTTTPLCLRRPKQDPTSNRVEVVAIAGLVLHPCGMAPTDDLPVDTPELRRLRVLAAYELALGQLLSEAVKDARTGSRHHTWKIIGNALGMSDSRANVRWKGIENQVPTRTGQRRKQEYSLLRIGETDKDLVIEIGEQLAERVLTPDEKRLWASVTRSILVQEGIGYQPTVDKWGRTTFHLTRYGAFVVCQDANTSGEPTGVVITAPTARGFGGNYVRKFLDDCNPAELVEEIRDFIKSVIVELAPEETPKKDRKMERLR